MRTTGRAFGMGPIEQFKPEWFWDKRGGALGVYIGKWGLTLGYHRGPHRFASFPLEVELRRESTYAIATLTFRRAYLAVYHPARDIDSLESRKPRLLRGSRLVTTLRR